MENFYVYKSFSGMGRFVSVQELLSPVTYPPAPKQKIVYNKIIPGLQAAGFVVEAG